MDMMASQITSLTIVYSTVYPDADQRKHQTSASLALVGPVNSPHRASNAENVSIWWRHHELIVVIKVFCVFLLLFFGNSSTNEARLSRDN